MEIGTLYYPPDIPQPNPIRHLQPVTVFLQSSYNCGYSTQHQKALQTVTLL